MNRTKAKARLEQLIEWAQAAWFEGRCPKCETIVRQETETVVQLGVGEPDGQTLYEGEVRHATGCPLEGFPDTAEDIAQRFGLLIIYGTTTHEKTLMFGPVAVLGKGDPRPPDTFTRDEL